MTIRQLCRAYLEAADKELIIGKGRRPKKSSTLYIDRGRIERHILPLLGSRAVRDLKTPDIARFMRDIATGKTAADVKTGFRGRAIVEGGAGTASRTVGLLGGILSFAVSEGIIPVNPARGVKRPADKRREIRLSADQYRALGKALEESEGRKFYCCPRDTAACPHRLPTRRNRKAAMGRSRPTRSVPSTGGQQRRKKCPSPRPRCSRVPGEAPARTEVCFVWKRPRQVIRRLAEGMATAS